MTTGRSEVFIETLGISAPGLQPDAARQLAQLVAQRLAGSLRPGPGESAVERLELTLLAAPDEQPQQLAERIARQVSLRVADTSEFEAGR